MELRFKRDTALRKKYFTPASFSHPAKLDSQLLLWLVREYTKPGEVILDPLAGSGTLMLACTLGRSVILVELEEKFCKICRDNWEKVRTMPQLGETMGDCQIIQGDARQLEGLVEKIITSPPYGNRLSDSEVDDGDPQRMSYQQALGKIDKIVTSPPYAEAHDKEPGGITKTNRKDLLPYSWLKEDNPDNISNLPYGQIENIITSPLRKGQGKGDLSIFYITFLEVDNPIALLVETLVPSSILSSLSGRAMPEVAVSLNNSSECRQKEINEISTNLKLRNKLNSLLVKVFGNRAFKAREPSFSITLKGAEDTPIALEAVWLDIEGIATQSTMALYLSSAGQIEAFRRAIITDTPFGFVNSNPELLSTLRASSPEASGLSHNSTSTGAVFTPTVCYLAQPLSKLFPTSLAVKDFTLLPCQIATYSRAKDTIAILQLGLIDGKFPAALPTNSDNCSTHLITLSTIPQIKPRINCIITSPPYEGSLTGDADSKGWDKLAQDPTSNRYGRKSHPSVGQAYSGDRGNIGNLKTTSYLSAMLAVYRSCWAVLKDGGLLLLVTKNFIRNKQVIRLDSDTILLCEKAGFELIERHRRILPAQSFWRTIYYKKFPEVEKIEHEDVLIFRKAVQ